MDAAAYQADLRQVWLCRTMDSRIMSHSQSVIVTNGCHEFSSSSDGSVSHDSGNSNFVLALLPVE